LWIAYRLEDKICVLRNGNLKSYGKADGVTSNPTTIAQDHEGTIWANTEAGVIRFNGTRWEHIGENWNFPEDVPDITSDVLFVDSRGTLWAGVNHTILYLNQGSKRFEPTGAYAGFSASIAEAPDGTIWLSDNVSYVRAISTSVSAQSAAVAKCEVETPEGGPPKCSNEGPLVVKISAPARLLFDRNESLWMTSDTSGVFRVPHPERLKGGPISKASDALQTFTSRDGLSADSCSPILEDREGNIWVGTRDGLDQFRDTMLVPVALPKSLIRVAIAPADGGDIWVAGSWNYVARIHGDSRDVSLIPAQAFKPYRDPAGVTWLLGDSLGQWKDGKFRRVAPSPYGLATGPGTWQIAGDRFGTLWAFSNGHGFFSLDHARWKAWATPPEVVKLHVANMYSDRTGVIWVSTYEGGIITMDRGTVVDYPVKPDSPLRDVKAFAEHAPQEIWAGGAGGLVLIDRGHFRPIKPAALDSLEDVTGIVDAGNDGLWLNAARGVIHISKDETERALRDPSYRFQWQRFDSSDGLPGQTAEIYPYPKAVQGTDGRIWFTATRGVAWIDPKGVSRNALPPPVSITTMSTDGSLHLQLTDLRLPAHTANVQINHTALSLSVPERVRFRYKLDGFDKAWQDVGNRRQAFYTNLGPGSYQFRVIACNSDGVWNEAGAILDFSILPAYYQTTWFRLLCGAAFLLLLWALYQLRLQQLRHQFTIGLEARVNERTRVARELHDTLLQSFQGAVFQFHAARKLLLRNADNVMQVIDEAIQAAEEGITEGRAAIHDLRPEPAAQRDLPELLKATGRELADTHQWNGNAPTFGVIVEGRQRDLRIMFQDEVYRISREVIRNAFAHAVASHIEVEIRYDQDQLRVRIRDDGKGIDPKILEDGGQPGHWGISGMRERAQRIGSRLDFWSEMGAGTEVQLTIPAAMAYEKRRHNR
jgi:signal transduction histidine kinase